MKLTSIWIISGVISVGMYLTALLLVIGTDYAKTDIPKNLMYGFFIFGSIYISLGLYIVFFRKDLLKSMSYRKNPP